MHRVFPDEGYSICWLLLWKKFILLIITNEKRKTLVYSQWNSYFPFQRSNQLVYYSDISFDWTKDNHPMSNLVLLSSKWEHNWWDNGWISRYAIFSMRLMITRGYYQWLLWRFSKLVDCFVFMSWDIRGVEYLD